MFKEINATLTANLKKLFTTRFKSDEQRRKLHFKVKNALK